MAKSKFLKWQDPDGDGLQDVCKDVVEVQEIPDCPECKPDPAYVSPNWKEQATGQPWYDKKLAEYKVTIVTTEDSLIPHRKSTKEESEQFVEEMFLKYQKEALDSLLSYYQKLDTKAIREQLKEVIINSMFDLGPRSGSTVKLLFSIPCFYFVNIPGLSTAEQQETDEEAESESGRIVVEYTAADIENKIIKFKKAMRLYTRYYRVYQWTNSSSLIEEKNGKVFSPNTMKQYGKGIMTNMLRDLDRWANTKGFNIPGIGGLDIGKDRITKIEFTFSRKYVLKKIKLQTVQCAAKPITFRKKGLRTLLQSESWKDPRACAYFSRLDDIENDLTARDPISWLDFVVRYTYPEVSPQVGLGQTGQRTTAGCVNDALKKEAKQLGQDLLDETFSIADAIAFSFNRNLCKPDLLAVRKEREELGLENLTLDELRDIPEDLKREEVVRGTALAQAFEEIKQDDDLFVNLCEDIVKQQVGIISRGDFEELWASLNRLKICGLHSLMLTTIKCLMGGLSLEQSLSKILKSALESLSIENYGKLFVGLPEQKQRELDELVKRKLKNGEAFKTGSDTQVLSDVIDGQLELVWPWKDPRIKNQKSTLKETVKSFTEETETPSEEISGVKNETPQIQKRTLAQKFDVTQYSDQLSPNIVIEAYILGLIEVYGNDLLSLVDELNKFPGGQIIAKTLALVDCPQPPIFDPNVLDFIKSVDSPFCKSPEDWKFPALSNKYKWMMNRGPILQKISITIAQSVQELIFNSIMILMTRLCNLLGRAICTTAETAGNLIASLPDAASGRTNIAEVVRQTICGEDADEQRVNDTLTEMFAKFGVGGAAFANQEDVISFFGDISMATTRAELVSAFQGNMSQEMAEIIDNVVQNRYPQFRDGLPNQQSIRDMFSDSGSLFPVEFRNNMDDFLNTLPDDDFAPANPSLCATPEQLEDFCSIRASLLEGRATREQAVLMCQQINDDLLQELGAISDAYHNDPISLPPLVSDPGCDNGIIPFQTEESKVAASIGFGSIFSQLAIDYATDMIGNGPGEANWGMVNMVLSDTMGNPLTAHWRKTNQLPYYVDFVATEDDDVDAGEFGSVLSPGPVALQIGNFPSEVAEHLRITFEDFDVEFESKNDLQNDVRNQPIPFRRLGINTFGGRGDPDLTRLPDFGYNIDYDIDAEDKTITVIEKARKKDPDVVLKFRDNNKGRRDWTEDSDDPHAMAAYGFDLQMYLADLEKNGTVSSQVGTLQNPVDSVRIKTLDKYNNVLEFLEEEEWVKYLPIKYKIAIRAAKILIAKAMNPELVTEEEREFLAVDDTLSTRDMSLFIRRYPTFIECFEAKKDYIPQIYLLSSMISEQNDGFSSTSTFKNFYDETMSELFNTFAREIAANEKAFSYGARYDNLPPDLAEYVVDDGQIEGVPGGTPYKEARIIDEEGKERRIKNKDAIMGLSRDQYLNGDDARVYYLNPMTYGGKFTNPKIYVKPQKNEGWLGMVNVLFPDFTACKPHNADLVDFKQIEGVVEEVYPRMPVDERLKFDPDCVVELPYNRVLERSATAGIQGLVTAACRIYASTYMIKSLATFTTFSPKFPENYSSIFAQYIVEEMEAGFKDTQSTSAEAFNNFKDTEFWYAFLEQSVQTYGRMVDEGQIIDPPVTVLQALSRINDMQEKYKYPFKEDLKSADVGLFKSLKKYRSEKNFEAVQATEEDAKLVLKEFVIRELEVIGNQMLENLKEVNMQPLYEDLDYYFLMNFVQGAESLNLTEKPEEKIVGVPTSGNNLFTNGQEFTTSEGENYVGYYHVHINEENETIYMEGAYHSEDPHPELVLSDSKIVVEIGDVQALGASFDPMDKTKPFLLEKYMIVDGVKMSPESAYAQIQANNSDSSLLVSDVYPGDLELVYRPGQEPGTFTNEVVGITGNIGLRYGIQLSIINGTSSSVVASVEVDSLDLPISQVPILQGDSKLLLCLLNHLKGDERFRLLVQYIFPLNKITSTLAMYNDKAFLNSIGEVTVDVRDAVPGITFDPIELKIPDYDDKPGIKIDFDEENNEIIYNSVNAWASFEDRNLGWSPFVKKWDEWDKEILANSRRRIKRILKDYYYSREFDLSSVKDDFNPVTNVVNDLRERMRRPAALGVVPRAKRRLIVKRNPFNAKGKMCDENE